MAKPDKKQAFDMARLSQYELLPDVIRSRRTAWYIAFGALLLALFCLVLILFLLPLKERYAFPILVDKTSGYTLVMQTPADMNNLHSDTITALDRHWIQHYLHARESYLPSRLTDYYERVRLMSCPTEFERYAWHYSQSNPQNYYEIYKDRNVKVTIKTIAPAGTMQDARGQTYRSYTASIEREFVFNQRAPDASRQFVPYEISLATRFRELKLEEKMLRLNPLGFEVCHYDRAEYLSQRQ